MTFGMETDLHVITSVTHLDARQTSKPVLQTGGKSPPVPPTGSVYVCVRRRRLGWAVQLLKIVMDAPSC